MALCELVQSGLGRRVRLAAVRRPQKLWSEGGTLGGAAVTELDDMRDREEADHVHQQLESKSCRQRRRAHFQTLFTTYALKVLHILSLLTFDPAHGVDNDGSLSALGASAPQGFQGFQVAV